MTEHICIICVRVNRNPFKQCHFGTGFSVPVFPYHSLTYFLVIPFLSHILHPKVASLTLGPILNSGFTHKVYFIF